jgi:hypothetical protein
VDVSADNKLTWLIMTTYGVSAAAGVRDAADTSAYSLDDDSGARCAVYDMGIEMPLAVRQRKSLRPLSLFSGRHGQDKRGATQCP